MHIHMQTQTHTQMSLFVQLRPGLRNSLIEFKRRSLFLMSETKPGLADLNRQTQLLLCLLTQQSEPICSVEVIFREKKSDNLLFFFQLEHQC